MTARGAAHRGLRFDTVVVAGGRSSRLGGTPKALLPVAGSTLLTRTVDAVLPLGTVVVVGPALVPAAEAEKVRTVDAGDPAAMIGRTTQASFSICVNPNNGRYYYRGSSGGAGVEIDDPTVTRTGAVVTNNDVLYSIDASEMSIYQGGELISSQPMLVLWTG